MEPTQLQQPGWDHWTTGAEMLLDGRSWSETLQCRWDPGEMKPTGKKDGFETLGHVGIHFL